MKRFSMQPRVRVNVWNHSDYCQHSRDYHHRHHKNQVITTTEDPNKLYNTTMCGTVNNRVINGQPVIIIDHHHQ